MKNYSAFQYIPLIARLLELGQALDSKPGQMPIGRFGLHSRLS
jgi:hypothetical protein